jgi:hypothetical protein
MRCVHVAAGWHPATSLVFGYAAHLKPANRPAIGTPYIGDGRAAPGPDGAELQLNLAAAPPNSSSLRSSASTVLPGYPSLVGFRIGNLRVSRSLVVEGQLNLHLAFENLGEEVETGLGGPHEAATR